MDVVAAGVHDPFDLRVARPAPSSWTGSASMSARSTTLRPGRPPSRVKMPPVSVIRNDSSMPSAAMWPGSGR